MVVDVLERAGDLLDIPAGPDAASLADQHTARQALGRVWDRTLELLTVAAADDRAPLIDLLRGVKAADDRAREVQAARQSRAAQAVHSAMAMLGSPSSVSALLRRGPVAAASLGFDRVLLSRIDNALWIPETAYFDRDATWAQQLVEIGRRQPRTLDATLLETEMVRRRVAMIVNDAQEQPSVHPELAAVTMSRSYAAAPIMAAGRVVGFLHADLYFQQRHPDVTDRETLWLFCEGLGHALARASVLDRLDGMRVDAERLAGHARSAATSAGWTAVPGSRTGGPASAAAPTIMGATAFGADPDPDDDGVLTRREVEVVRLMAGGDTNAQIATRLLISEGTVKTHVKHILRKLDSANRAEAVSRWMRNDTARERAR